MRVAVCSTLAAFVMDQPDTWASWLRNAEQLQASHPEGVHYFAALELDARGVEPFQPLLDRLSEVNGEHWTFTLDDGRTEVTTANRLRHITMGQNLCTDYCVSHQPIGHMLFMAADCMAPDDVIPKMLEMDYPLVAPFITTYGLRGTRVPGFTYHVENAMASAACIFIARDVFRRVRWRWDFEDGSDDPCFHRDAMVHLRTPTYVRHDCVAKHFPETIGAIETRGHDMRVYR